MVGGVKATIIALLVFSLCLVGCETTLVETPPAPQSAIKASDLYSPSWWHSDPKEPNNYRVERAIRSALNKPTGWLTKADLEKVTKLNLAGNLLTDVTRLEKLTQLKELNLTLNRLTSLKGLENLKQLTYLNLADNPNLTEAQIDELRRALPNCKIPRRAPSNP